MKNIVYAVLVWFALGLTGFGFTNAHFQSKYSDQCNGKEELGFALFMSSWGLVGLGMGFLFSGFGQYGWSLSPHYACMK